MSNPAGAKRFGEVLRTRRSAAGYSCRGLARALSYTPGWISRVENGKVAPGLEFAERCDGLLGTGTELTALAQAAQPDVHGLLRPSQLPPVAGHFVGRGRDLLDLDSYLEDPANASASCIIAIDGPAGVGKSTLAVQWGSQIAHRFTGGVFFADLQGHALDGSPIAPAQILERFLLSVGIAADRIPPGLDERAAIVRTLAEGRPTLFVLDNAADADQVEPLLVGAPASVVIVTSRRRLTRLTLRTGAHRVCLGPMKPDESGALLRAVIGPRADAEPDASRALADRCVHLPIALRIAAERLAAHPHRTVASTVAELDADRLDALADADDPHLAVRPILAASYRDLTPDVARAFRLIGLYPGSTISTDAAAALLGRAAARARRQLDALVAVHLLEEIGADRFRAHDLLREYAAELAAELSEESRTAAVARLVGWYAHTVDRAAYVIAPQRPIELLTNPPTGTQPLGFITPEEASQWCDDEAENFLPVVRLASRHGLPAAWQIPTRLWNYLLVRKPWTLWIDSHEVGLQAAVAAGDREAEAWVSLNLADGWRQTGDTDRARHYAQDALRLREQLGDRHGQGWCEACLGFIATDEAEPEQARSHFEAALGHFQMSGDRHGQGVLLACLAETHAHLGDRDRARASFDASLALARELGDHYGEGMLWNRRAGAHRARGELDDALTCLERRITSGQAAADEWGIADAYEQRGDILAELEREGEAREAWQRAFRIFSTLEDPRAAALRERLGVTRPPEP
ncbi:helix-turn-helix domain-containing protein [Streptomyces rimosus]|uniref:XRE family transcriptional regulator n=1 Tax=Streptomyces rimosus TaxID=1927 RepID=UPI00067C7203|nr:XRE family transcriptional regulator [Streptomyces rimosus]